MFKLQVKGADEFFGGKIKTLDFVCLGQGSVKHVDFDGFPDH